MFSDFVFWHLCVKCLCLCHYWVYPCHICHLYVFTKKKYWLDEENQKNASSSWQKGWKARVYGIGPGWGRNRKCLGRELWPLLNRKLGGQGAEVALRQRQAFKSAVNLNLYQTHLIWNVSNRKARKEEVEIRWCIFTLAKVQMGHILDSDHFQITLCKLAEIACRSQKHVWTFSSVFQLSEGWLNGSISWSYGILGEFRACCHCSRNNVRSSFRVSSFTERCEWTPFHPNYDSIPIYFQSEIFPSPWKIALFDGRREKIPGEKGSPLSYQTKHCKVNDAAAAGGWMEYALWYSASKSITKLPPNNAFLVYNLGQESCEYTLDFV